MNKYGHFRYSDYAVGAKEQAEYAVNCDLQQGSALTQLSVGVQPYDYASFERDAYITATPKKLYKSGALGLLSKTVSDENGEFKTPIVLSAKFSSFFSMTGITISSRNIIKEIQIDAFQVTDTAKMVATGTFSAVGKTMFYPINIEKANLIKFTIKKIDKPNAFFGIFNIEYGKIRNFDEKTRIKSTIASKFSLLGDTLEYDTLDLTIIKPETSGYLFQKKQPLDYMLDEKVQLRFFVDKGTEDEEQTIRILAYDIISALEDEFLGGMYAKKDLKQLIGEILAGTGVPYDVSAVPAIELDGYLPISSRRKALQSVLLASNIRCYKSDKLVFAPIETELQSVVLDKTNIIKMPRIEKKQEIKSVIVSVHNFSKKQEEKEVYHWYMSKTEDIMIKFSEPLHDLKAFEVIGTDEYGNDEISSTPTDKVTFVKAEPNYCIVKNTSANKIVIRGKGYSDSVVEIRKNNPILAEGESYLEIPIDLKIHANPNAVCDTLYSLYARQNKITFRTIEKLKIGCLYNILGEKLNIKSIRHELNGVYEVEAI